MDNLEVQILEKACETFQPVDVGADHDKLALNAVYSLCSRGYLRFYHDCKVDATPAGRAALSEYHETRKNISKHGAKETRKEKRNLKSAFLIAICSAVFGAVVTFILDRIF